MIQVDPGQCAPLFGGEFAEHIVLCPWAGHAAAKGFIEIVEQTGFFAFEIPFVGHNEFF